MNRGLPVASAVLVLGFFAAPIPAAADSPPVSSFDPTPLSEPVFGIRPPSEDPDRQRHVVETADGVDVFVETWLPTELGGNVPPDRVPTILQLTPYAPLHTEEFEFDSVPEIEPLIDHFVPRGYAYSVGHLRGTGASGGCLDQSSPTSVDDAGRMIEYLGRDAPWSDGNVGMYGVSYDAETQLGVAGSNDHERTKYLKAIIPVSSIGGAYEYVAFDGVPYTYFMAQTTGVYVGYALLPTTETSPSVYAEKFACQSELIEASADVSGDWSEVWQRREFRRNVQNVRAATLMVHGLADYNVLPLTAAGWFDRLPETTPKKGLFGIWDHARPSDHPVRPEWNRTDWMDMITAWFDRYLLGLPTRVEDWPDVQVQGTDGQWRVEPEWPTTGGPVGHLALGPAGVLGDPEPTGSTTYSEGLGVSDGDPTATPAIFDTGPLPERLALTGQPVLDLWVTLDQPDAHFVAELQAFDASGVAIIGGLNWSMRSAQHLEPIRDGYFAQESPVPAPVGKPVHVEMRFLPTDVVVPAGGSLRLIVSGTLGRQRSAIQHGIESFRGSGSIPSGAGTNVTILHDCSHPTSLRFLMPRPEPELLVVRDVRPEGEQRTRGGAIISDAGGLATAPVCGRAPIRTPILGPALDAHAGDHAAGPTSPEPMPATGSGLAAAFLLIGAGLFLSLRGEPAPG